MQVIPVKLEAALASSEWHLLQCGMPDLSASNDCAVRCYGTQHQCLLWKLVA